MAIKDLEVRQGNIDIIVDVVDIGEVREFEKFGKTGRVATAIVKDETGDCKLSLWNEDIDKVKAGDKIHIINGYVNEWQGEKQLTTGRLGKIEVVEESKESREKETSPEKEELEGDINEKEEVDEEPVTEEETVENEEK